MGEELLVTTIKLDTRIKIAGSNSFVRNENCRLSNLLKRGSFLYGSGEEVQIYKRRAPDGLIVEDFQKQHGTVKNLTTILKKVRY